MIERSRGMLKKSTMHHWRVETSRGPFHGTSTAHARAHSRDGEGIQRDRDAALVPDRGAHSHDHRTRDTCQYHEYHEHRGIEQDRLERLLPVVYVCIFFISQPIFIGRKESTTQFYYIVKERRPEGPMQLTPDPQEGIAALMLTKKTIKATLKCRTRVRDGG